MSALGVAHDYLRCACHDLCCVCHVPIEIDVDGTDDGEGGMMDATRIISAGAVDCRELGHDHRLGERGFACASCASRANAA